MNKQQILIVEDNATEQKLLSMLVTRLGYTFRIAASGEQALELLGSAQKFALVLMDWTLPDMDGLDCTRIMRRMEKSTGRRTPVVAVTARAMLGDKQTCLDAGMDDYLSKPFTFRQFEQMLRYWAPTEATMTG